MFLNPSTKNENKRKGNKRETGRKRTDWIKFKLIEKKKKEK